MASKTKTQKEIDKLLKIMPVDYLEFAGYLLGDHSPISAYRLIGKQTGNDQQDRIDALAMSKAPLVTAYIQAVKRRVAEKSIMTLEEIDQRLTEIATTNIVDIIDLGTKTVPIVSNGELITSVDQPEVKLKPEEELTASQLASIKSVKVVKGELHIETHDQIKALDMLIKRRSGYKEIKEINHNGNVHVFAAVDDNGRGPDS